MDVNFRDQRLIPVWEKVQKGERLSLQDGLVMFRTGDIISLGKMAHAAGQQKSGDVVYFALNRKIEPTNICILSCRFCVFAAKRGKPGAYEMTIEDILGRLTPHIQEIHITGALHPDWKWQHYLRMISAVRQNFPNINIKAFTAVEADFFHKKFKLPLREVLLQLKEAGLDTMPGGGAEVFSERIRKLLFPQKIGAKTWLEVHKTAHRLGIPTNATLLYGHIETYEERLNHMIKLREAQDETNGFLTFIPLAFQAGSTGIKPRPGFASAIDDLKTIAVSRLMLDSFPHIKAYWVMLTEEIASVALNFGADDMDGTVGGERIAHDAGATSPAALTKDRIIRIIREARKIPVERDAYYNPVNIYTENVIGKIPYLNSIPFYEYFEKGEFNILPVTPRQMGILSSKGQIDAAPFSLMDYFAQEDRLETMAYCIAARNQVKSILLFARESWARLAGKDIGITEETATSVKLLHVLLEKKYGLRTNFVRMHPGVNDYDAFAAVLLIGDEALKRKKTGISGFKFIFDLAKEWYAWQKLPFVFALWALQKSLPIAKKLYLQQALQRSLERAEEELDSIGCLHGKQIGLSSLETKEYLEGIIYRIGEREMKAISVFRKLLEDIEEAGKS
ncbi:MAG: aminofutalosine synthase MqnE [Syntrophaceae bacterium CG2_30_49_12]|nr:MAG: aminofutalosine synthase MqnE [Syntrophaceae bacterium CG2_30_49_12]PIP05900.1 MAG: aminofutalosine synthase MqnE [Syntrophobacterales bacterium CG23_combo_of_CG06-09_8_20_14_all_48_27]PJC73332.1 MAG: aminofutalosine synthase MqnE [Syntrophobacterales bacterium CG_4_8_14_3_um_filter_49_14]